MDFQFTPEHEELRQSVRKFLTDKSTEQAVRRAMATDEGYDREVWKQMAEQMGLAGLTVEEEHGGAGLGFVELGIVMEEMGSALLCAPYLSTAVLAVNALQLAGSEAARADLLPRIAAGETTATLAYVEPGRGWDVASTALQATRSGQAWELNGEKTYVLDGLTADELLVAARTGEGVSLFRLRGEADGVQRELLPTLDLTRKLARIRFTRARAEQIANAADVTAALQKTVDLATAALAAEQTGGSRRCMEMSTEYARTRLQFGRPIGSFQAIKHRCADMLVATEFSKSAAYHAIFRAAEQDDPGFAIAVRMAKSYCSEAFFQIANDTIQVHGGMGFTWEHPAHLYFKRARSSAILFGEPAYHREKLSGAVGI